VIPDIIKIADPIDTMSKGKRHSLPGSVAIVREKIRNGWLTPQDRAVLMQVSRVDLIALIEQEMGVALKSSQKNSVRAMVDWLIGPDEAAEQQARSVSVGQGLEVKISMQLQESGLFLLCLILAQYGYRSRDWILLSRDSSSLTETCRILMLTFTLR